jgi:Salmonella virulence-associated 28kDa protein
MPVISGIVPPKETAEPDLIAEDRTSKSIDSQTPEKNAVAQDEPISANQLSGIVQEYTPQPQIERQQAQQPTAISGRNFLQAGSSKLGRLALKINIDLPRTNPEASSARPSPVEMSDHKLQETLGQMAQLQKPSFAAAQDTPTYEEFTGGSKKFGSFQLDPLASEDFTIAHKDVTSGYPTSDEKIHLSIKKEDAAKAFEAVAPLLFSSQSPIDTFKMTNLEGANKQATGGATEETRNAAKRVSDGAQFTLYLKPSPNTGEFDADHLNNIKGFVEAITDTFKDKGIQTGEIPKSDAKLADGYASFRLESANREDKASDQVKQNPIYQILNATTHPSNIPTPSTSLPSASVEAPSESLKRGRSEDEEGEKERAAKRLAR